LFFATQRGRGKSGSYEAMYEDGVLTLYHYGALIAQYDYKVNKITTLGGYSNSDRDAINSFLMFVGSSASVSRAKSNAGKGYPTMSGWYIIR
jgi:hypothetical protein